MSPEQAQGLWNIVGPASDVYSLGATLFEVLAGKPPVEGSVSDVMQKVIAGQVPSLRKVNPEASPAIEAVVMKALAHKPEQRYQSAKELADEVDRWLADEPVRAFPEPWRDRARRWVRRHRTLTATTAVLVLTALIAVSVGLWFVNEEQKKTDTARRVAVKAEKSASEQRQLALATIKRVVDDIDSRLRNRAASKELRRALLDEAMRGLSDVARAADTADAIDRQQYLVHLELGEIFLRIESGGTVKAVEQFEKARDIARRLHDQSPNNDEVKSDLAQSLRKLGDALEQRGKPEATQELYAEVLEIRRGLHERDPNQVEKKRQYANALLKLGDIDLLRKAVDVAVKRFEESLKLSEQLAAANPDNVDIQRDKALALERLASAERLGNSKSALDRLQQAAVIYRALLQKEPENPKRQRDVAMILLLIGELQLVNRDVKDALRHLSDSETICKAMLDKDQNNTLTLKDLAQLLWRRGQAHFAEGKVKEALAALEDSRKRGQSLVDGDKDNADLQRQLILTLNSLGSIHLQQGDTKAALASLTQARQIQEKHLLPSDKQHSLNHANYCTTLETIGHVHLTDKKPDLALEAYKQSLAIRERFAADKENAVAQQSLGLTLMVLGRGYLALPDHPLALQSFERSSERFRALLAKKPKDVQLLRQVSSILADIGKLHLHMGNPRATLKIYLDCLEMDQRLVALYPENAGFQHDVFVSYVNLAEVQLQLDDYQEAINWFQKALDQARRSPRPEFYKSDIPQIERAVLMCRGAIELLENPAGPNVKPLVRLDAISYACSTLTRKKQGVKAVVLAETLAKEAKEPDDFRKAVGCFAQCAEIAEKPEERERLALRAIEMLRQAIDKGFKNAADLNNMPDVKSIRMRDDFRNLVEQLEKLEKPRK